MKKTIFGMAAVAAIALSSFTGSRHSEVYKVDTTISTLEWFAEKLTGKHNGTLKISSGSIINDHGKLSGTMEVDMTSIACTDLDTVWGPKLVKHLKSEDFFNTAKYPTSKFVITSITPVTGVKEGGFTHNVKGNLTIKDKTNEISFDALIKSEGNKIVCIGTAVVDRSKFDVKYGSKSFFPEIGDKMIYDEFKLKFNIAAVK